MTNPRAKVDFLSRARESALWKSYSYDGARCSAKVTDASGNTVGFAYDAVGEIVQIVHSAAPAIGWAISVFTPHLPRFGTTVEIQGQNFKVIGNKAVNFSRLAARVVSANSNPLTVTVRTAATLGSISVTACANIANPLVAHSTVRMLRRVAIQRSRKAAWLKVKVLR